MIARRGATSKSSSTRRPIPIRHGRCSASPRTKPGARQILGAPRIVEGFADLSKEVPGLDAGRVEIRSG